MPNRSLELLHFEQFSKLQFNSNFEFSELAPPEPDFIVFSEGKKIGIEHTCLIRLPDNNGVNFMAHSKFADEIMQKAKLLYITNHSLCLMVHVSFRCDYGLSLPNPIQLQKYDVDNLSMFISDFVIRQLPILEKLDHFNSYAYEDYDMETGEILLPEKIEHIRITNTKNFKNPCWSANQGAAIPGIFNSDEFKILLAKKNEKPKNYKNHYDEIWLLLVEDSMDLTSYLHFDDPVFPTITTKFDRVFVLRRAEGILYNLKTIKQTSS